MNVETSLPSGSFRRRIRQQGVVLVIALVLLLALTIVAVGAMRSTTVDLKITFNLKARNDALIASESTRVAAGWLVDNHVAYRGWTGFDMPNFVYATPYNGDPATASALGATSPSLYEGSPSDLGDVEDGDEDFWMLATRGGAYQPERHAKIFVTRLATRLAPGSGAATSEGYVGLGRGSAGGGASLLFDIRSRGYDGSASNATSNVLTGANFRHVVR